MSKDPYARRTMAVRAILHATWPDVFAGKGQPKQPLAVGIGDRVALALPELGTANVRRALSDYANGPTYLRSCVEGAARIGLDGQPNGVVTADQAAFAKARLAANETFWSKQKPKEVANV